MKFQRGPDDMMQINDGMGESNDAKKVFAYPRYAYNINNTSVVK